jgi:hypothetical protein
MKRILARAATGRTAAAFTAPLSVAMVLAAAGPGVLASCGGDDRLAREDFSNRLQSIDRRGGERWGRLARQARYLKPARPLPARVQRPMRELVEFQREAAGELAELDVPEDAEDGVEKLIEALRARTETFQRVIEAGRFTARQFDQITESGDGIDLAFEQLREEGFLPGGQEHAE